VSEQSSPPRENLIRAVSPGVEVRAADDGGHILFGHFARFNEWAEINSRWEGHFMERFAPGAFKKTFSEQRHKIRVLFQHGHDPEVGDKPIAAITELREDEEGAYYEARLFDGLPPLVVEGLRAGQYGASMNFGALRESWNDTPEPSEHNPNGLRERTVKESRVPEFGPVTFPAYANASAGVRSMTDEFLLSAIRSNPDSVREMLKQAVDLATPTITEQDDAPSERDAEPGPEAEVHLTDERRDEQPTATPRRPFNGTRRKEKSPSWLLGPSKSTKRT
jgi:HK97 family phage prohead protease